MMSRLLLALACSGWICTVSCTAGPRPQPDPTRSRRLTAYSFIEEGKLILLVVNVEAARYRAGEKYLPLLVAVGNRGVRQPLRVTRESFYLVGPEGQRTGVASTAEVIRDYHYISLDRRILADLGYLEAKFDFYRFMPTNFFPNPSGRNVIRDRTGIPRLTYFADLFYFPMPEGGIRERRFDLFFTDKELEDPVFVTFEITPARAN